MNPDSESRYHYYLECFAYAFNKLYQSHYSLQQIEFLIYRELTIYLSYGIVNNKTRHDSPLKALYKWVINTLQITRINSYKIDKVLTVKSRALIGYFTDYTYLELKGIRLKRVSDLSRRLTFVEHCRKFMGNSYDDAFARSFFEELIDNYIIYKKYLRYTPSFKNPVTILSSSYPSLYLRLLLIENSDKVSIECIQHGGNYFENLFAMWERIEIRIYTKFYSWFDVGNPKVFPAIPYKPLDVKDIITKTATEANRIVLILNARLSIDNQYYLRIAQYLSKYSNVYVRLRHGKHSDLDFQLSFIERYKNLSIDDSESIYEAIGRAEIVYIDQPFTTSFWESKIANKLTYYFSAQYDIDNMSEWYKNITNDNRILL
jgi:hypothetical protein